MRYIPGLDDVAFSSGVNDICDIEWCGKGFQTSLPSGITTSRPVIIGKVFPKGYSYNDECGVYYINNRDGSRPYVGLETASC